MQDEHNSEKKLHNDLTAEHLGPFDRVDYPDLRTPEPEAFTNPTYRPFGRLDQKFPRGTVGPNVLMIGLAVWATFFYWRSVGSVQLAADRVSVFEGGAWWLLFTTLFVHADLAHFLSNFSLIVIFGALLRGYYGQAYYPLGALLMGAGGMLVTLWLSPVNVKIIGASGMLYSMVTLWLILYLYYERRISWAKRLLRITAFAMMMLLPSTYSPTTSYLAHGVGAAVGLLAGLGLLALQRAGLGGELEK